MKKLFSFSINLIDDRLEDIQYICFLLTWASVLLLVFALPEDEGQVISITRGYFISFGLKAFCIGVGGLIVTSILNKNKN